MSIGNLKDNGNKGNNFPYQLSVLQLLGSINSGIAALPGVDYETRTSLYQATAAGPGYSIGDIIIRYDIIDVASATIVSTLWFNQTTQSAIAAPAPGNITPISAPSSVTVINGVGGAAVNIQDGGNSITVDSTTLATEATLVSLLNTILLNSTSKINRISGSADYSRVLTYHLTTTNVTQIVHTGTTIAGVEVITETITYVDPNINGSNIISIIYS